MVDIVIDAGANDYNRGVFLDSHDINETRRFKMFGGVNLPPVPKGSSSLRTAVSADGKRWTDFTPATAMDVVGDTANNALWDADLKQYLAFSRRHCSSMACHGKTEGNRRETRSTSTKFLGGWTNATECAHGEAAGTYEMYSLTPFRHSAWRPGLYFGIGSFYAESKPEGRVYCELMMSTDFAKTWTRLAPHKPFIPHSADSNATYPAGWDSHTCYSANGIVSLTGNETRFYYAGGNGPHSGGGIEHGRRNSIGLATSTTHALAALQSVSAARASLTTRPVAIGSALRVLMKVEDCSSVIVRIFASNDAQQPLSGFDAGVCKPLFDAALPTEEHHPQWHSISWPHGDSTSSLAGDEAVLQFDWHGSIYAFGFML